MTTDCSILLVEDDEDFLAILVRRFLRRGMSVVGVGDFDQALQAAQRQHFHVAIVDRTLPGSGSGQLVARLKAVNHDLRVIVLSGHSDPLSMADALDQGAAEYLTKPCGLAELERAVSRALGVADLA
jgi:DNA-binding NtrC family response regulator